MRAWSVACLVPLLVCQPILGAAADDVLSVEASPPLSPAPGLVRLLVRVERDAANRSLVVEMNSLALFRSSLITLEGESAQAAHWLEFDSLPAGLYTVTVSLHRDDGEAAAIAEDTFTVVP
jgi:hypothetical protein